MLVVALLDSFYTSSPRHWGTLAPLWWYPGDSSVSSRNLRRMVPPGAEILCINSCPYIVENANKHGKPEPLYVASLLRRLEPYDVLLVCGNIAKATFKQSPYKGYGCILFIPHPAWRAWSFALFSAVQESIVSAVAQATSESQSLQRRRRFRRSR